MEPVYSEPDFTNPFRRRGRPDADRAEAEPAAGAGGAGGEGGAGGASPASPAPLHYRAQDWLYDMAGHKHMLIFNHYRYQKSRLFRKQPTPRVGTARDVARLATVFGALGFRVATHHDRTHDQILDIISKLCKEDHSGTSCVAVCVLTHGAARGELLAADRPYELRDLLAPLQAAPALAGRPKLLVVQACRGAALDAGTVLDGGGAARIGSHADTLILTSSIEDYVSWRDENGSWLIQELCRVVEATHRHLDLLQMTALVTAAVTRDRASNTPSELALHGMKQTPETRSTLTKLLRLSPATPAPPAPVPPADHPSQDPQPSLTP